MGGFETPSGHLSARLIVTVESPSGRRTVAVQDDALVDELIPSLVEEFEGAEDSRGWRLIPQGEPPLAGAKTLRECGLFAGAVISLVAPERLATPAPSGHRAETPVQDLDHARETAYVRLLEDAIVAPPLGASNVIAVIADHPGTGATTVAILLATLLSSLRDDRLAAVDANPESGALSHWLAPDSSVSRSVYASLFQPDLAPEQVRSTLVSAGPRLTVLPAPSEPASAVATQAGWSRIIEHVRHLHNNVIVDCGAGISRAVSQAAIDAADAVVLVSKPSASAIRAPGARTLVMVANQARRRARASRSADGVQHVTIVYDPHQAKRLRTHGFNWAQAPTSWQESVRELAAVLVGSRGQA